MLVPQKKIDPPRWMRLPETLEIMTVLNKGVETPQALFVGGCVRNTMLGREVSDIDIATQLEPEEVIKRLEAAEIRAIPTGVSHGTVTAVVERRPFEITTLRKDVETDGRRAVVSFTTDWAEDAQRRDFTINALLADLDGNIYDPTGLGLGDLDQHKVRFVGAPSRRIAEDYLRILRFFRFYGWYGKGNPDEEALRACREGAPGIGKLSKERITHELLKILEIDDPAPVLTLMLENGILQDLRGGDESLEVLDRTAEMQRIYCQKDVMARLLALSGMPGVYPESIENWLMLSRAQKKELAQLTESVAALGDDMAIPEMKILMYRQGRYLAWQIVLLKLAFDGRNEIPADVLMMLENWIAPEFPLSGRDLQDAGVSQGPEVGRLLGTIEEWWIKEDMRPDRQQCLETLQGMLNG